MKIKCVQCDIVKDISKEDIDKVKSIIEESQISKCSEYLEIFNITKGKCKEQKRHTFIFEETFANSVQGLVNDYSDQLSAKAKDDEELSKINEKVIELENTLKNAKEKKENLIESVKKIEINIDNILQEFERITGDKNIDIWR